MSKTSNASKTAKTNVPRDFSPPVPPFPGDRPVYNLDIPAPATHEDRARMIVGLPMPALVALMADSASHGNLDVLRTALQIGTFDFSREIVRDHQAVHSVAAASAVMAFLKNTELETWNIDPVLGLLTQDIGVLQSYAKDDFKVFFAEFGRHLVAESRACMARNFGGFDDITRSHWCEGSRMPDACSALMGKVLVGAFALDDVELAREIVTHSPYVLNELMPSDLLGGQSPVAVNDNGQVYACPIYHALEFGRQGCMAAVRAAAPEEPPFAMRIRQHDSDRPPLPIGRDDNSVGEILNFFDCVHILAQHGAVIPTTPTVLSEEMRRTFSLASIPSSSMNSLHAVAMFGMARSGHRFFPYFAGFDANNVYGIHPTETVMQAIRFGHPDRVSVQTHEATLPIWRDVHWPRVFTSDMDLERNPIAKGMAAASQSNQPHKHEQAIVNAIRRACEEGFAHLAIQQHGQFNLHAQAGGGDCKDLPLFMAVPLSHFLVQNFNQVVLALVKAGMDPNKPTLEGGTTPQQDADKVSPSCAHTLRTFSMRQRALDTLAEMEVDATPSKRLAP